MNRRSYFKSFLVLGGLSIGSITIFKWAKIRPKCDIGLLLKKKNVVAELADIIIPRTDTPGAKDAGVENYIISVITNCYDAQQQQVFLDGIADLEGFCYENFGQDFLFCSLEDRYYTLNFFYNKSEYSNAVVNKIRNRLFGKPFYLSLRDLTVEGYCLSKLGATRGLKYDYIPGTFEACVPLQDNQLSWATK